MKILTAVSIACLTTSVGVLAAPAFAGDIQGDAYDCKELWVMRNEIFKANGYCFKTPKTIAHFGNAGCLYDSEAAVPMSQQDRMIVHDIRKSEARQRC